ncbi:MAG: Mov34/MPN/PAD-1 family protein [Dehalococcoidia bacterium]|nr:Mov34/MPN/PAD-1 family protein [Dehalococcoidia bacterium]
MNNPVNPVGHIIRKNPEDRWGYEGSFYQYVLAGNGLFVEGGNDLLWARVLVAEAEVRALEPLEPGLELKHGKVSDAMGLNIIGLLLHSDVELYLAVLHGRLGYELHRPSQEQGPTHTRYERPQGRVLFEVHSHPKMKAFFSMTDTQDEQGLGVYGVMGDHAGRPALRLRVGVYGYFAPVRWGQVFESPLPDPFVDYGEVNDG